MTIVTSKNEINLVSLLYFPRSKTCHHVGWKTAIDQNVRQTIEQLGAEVQDTGHRPAVSAVPADRNGE